MNRKQRDKNRATARALFEQVRPRFRCPRCGGLTPTQHYGGGVVNGRFVGGWFCQIP